MRTHSDPISSGHGSARMACCPATAAARAADAVWNAARTASPTVLKWTPRWTVMASSSNARWRSTAIAIAAGSRSQSAVLPSMSVKRKVTVPEGRSGIGAPRSRVMEVPAGEEELVVARRGPAPLDLADGAQAAVQRACLELCLDVGERPQRIVLAGEDQRPVGIVARRRLAQAGEDQLEVGP